MHKQGLTKSTSCEKKKSRLPLEETQGLHQCFSDDQMLAMTKKEANANICLPRLTFLMHIARYNNIVNIVGNNTSYVVEQLHKTTLL